MVTGIVTTALAPVAGAIAGGVAYTQGECEFSCDDYTPTIAVMGILAGVFALGGVTMIVVGASRPELPIAVVPYYDGTRAGLATEWSF
jgi:hypothetical protein